MNFRHDDSVESNNLPNSYNTFFDEDNNLYRAMVIETVFTDDVNNPTRNSTNPRVLYDVVILGGRKEGQILNNCRLSSLLSGSNNFFERVLQASTKELDTVPLEQHDGDIVFVQFLQGHSGYSIITGLDESFTRESASNATAEDGVRLLSQFNGVRTEINSDGEYCLIRRGGSIDPESGLFVPTAVDASPNFEGRLKLQSNEMIWEDPQNSIKFLKEEKTLTLSSGEGAVISKLDGANETFVTTFKSGLEILADGSSDKVEIATNSGVSIVVDGASSSVTIAQGATQIVMDGNTGKISLSGGLVDIGASVSDFAVLFTQLLTVFNTHTHIVPQAPSGALPSNPPIVPMTAAVRSTTIKVQS